MRKTNFQFQLILGLYIVLFFTQCSDGGTTAANPQAEEKRVSSEKDSTRSIDDIRFYEVISPKEVTIDVPDVDTYEYYIFVTRCDNKVDLYVNGMLRFSTTLHNNQQISQAIRVYGLQFGIINNFEYQCYQLPFGGGVPSGTPNPYSFQINTVRRKISTDGSVTYQYILPELDVNGSRDVPPGRSDLLITEAYLKQSVTLAPNQPLDPYVGPIPQIMLDADAALKLEVNK